MWGRTIRIFTCTFFYLLAASLFGQETFVRSKAKIKSASDGTIQMQFVKILTASGSGSIFLRKMNDVPASPEVWEVFTEPGGKIEMENKKGFWGKARLGQVYVEIERIHNDADGFSGWRLFTRKDTVYVSEWQQISDMKPLYSASMFRRYHQLLLPTGEPFDIHLLVFRQEEPGKNLVEISESGKISDYPKEFQVLATLILMRSLANHLYRKKQR